MIIEKTTEYTIKLSWEELRDISNALSDALYLRKEFGLDLQYPTSEYQKLQVVIEGVLYPEGVNSEAIYPCVEK